MARAPARRATRPRGPTGRLSPAAAVMIATAMPTAKISRLAMGPNHVVNEPVVGRRPTATEHAFQPRDTTASAAVLAVRTAIRRFLLASRRQARGRRRPRIA